MPRIAKITLLPAPLRMELSKRLVASGFGDIKAHASWLADQGVSIGKSAIGEWALKNRTAIELSVLATSDGALPDASEASLRMRCLEVASGVGGPPDDLTERAEKLFAWVVGSRQAD